MSVIHRSREIFVPMLVVGVLAACILPLGAVAAPTIDGKIDETEYTESYNVNIMVDGKKAKKNDPANPDLEIGGGRLLIHVDQVTGDVYLAFEQPTDLVDNSYGDYAVGWGDKDHKFSDLRGSDTALFLFTDDQGKQIVDVLMDYLYETDTGYDSGIEPGKESYVKPESLEPMVTGATSLDYNLNNLEYDLTVDSPQTVNADSYELVSGSEYTGWIFEVIYEMKIDGEVFAAAGGFDVSMLDIDVVHDSPNKIGDKAVDPEIETNGGGGPGPSGAVPEPMTMLAVGMGIAGLGGYLRKRRGTTAP